MCYLSKGLALPFSFFPNPMIYFILKKFDSSGISYKIG